MTTTEAAPTLDALFAKAIAHLSQVDDAWPALTYLCRTPPPPQTIPPPPDSVSLAIKNLTRLSDAVSQASLISSNETLDEIPTSTLKYLLLPFLLARAHAQVHGETYERHATLMDSRRWLNVFFERADNLRLLSERERDVALEETPTSVMSSTERRETKIGRFKMEKETERKLALMRERMSNSGADEEEVERELALVVLQSAVRKALDFLDNLEQEMEVLTFAVRQLERGVDPREKAERSRPKGPVPGIGGMPASFRIVSDKEKAREGVFRPSHSLPTYTVEEWGEIEMERMAKAEMEKRDKDIVEAKRKEEEDSDGEEAVERERLKKSRWDDWTDEHNKGSGNTIR